MRIIRTSIWSYAEKAASLSLRFGTLNGNNDNILYTSFYWKTKHHKQTIILDERNCIFNNSQRITYVGSTYIQFSKFK